MQRNFVKFSPTCNGLWVACVLAGLMFVGACREYRIEHRKRPGFYHNAAVGELPSEMTLEDGTVIKYSSNHIQSSYGRSGDEGRTPFLIREESEDGKTITLRALLPEHVLMNTLACLGNEEYELLWDQMLSEQTKRAYADAGQGFEHFAEVFRKNRHDYFATLNRMVAGLPHQEVSKTKMQGEVTRCKLRPQIADGGEFKFRIVDVVQEGQQMKLLMIE